MEQCWGNRSFFLLKYVERRAAMGKLIAVFCNFGCKKRNKNLDKNRNKKNKCSNSVDKKKRVCYNMRSLQSKDHRCYRV